MILKGDCIEIMKAIKPNSVDAVITDPPYGLEFMGKEWDRLWDKREFGIDEYSKKPYTCSDGSTRKTNPVSRKLKNPNYKAGLEAQLWHTQWLTEAYRVLKPGASMLVMGGTRTFHRLMVAIEDTGFIIKDTLMYVYGSGFPKAQDLGKMIDKRMGRERKVIDTVPSRMPQAQAKGWGNPGIDRFRDAKKGTVDLDITVPTTDLAKHWDGFKIGGIKPAYEPIVWAVKPPEGSYVDNVLKWGVGAVNVDECRVELTKYDHEEYIPHRIGCKDGIRHIQKSKADGIYSKAFDHQVITPKGRFPANIILDEEAGRLLDEQSGNLKSGGDSGYRKYEHSCFMNESQAKFIKGIPSDAGGASRFFYCAKASRGERNRGLEGMEEKKSSKLGSGIRSNIGNAGNPGKTSSEDRRAKNNHPTVKPISLFEWLIKLVTREGQIVLDPFLGSGTTAIAAHKVNRECVGIEREGEYIEIAKRRIGYWESQPQQQELRV